MMNKFILFLFLSTGLFAQTGIGTTTPNASAKLDVFSTNKGFLPPRIALLSTTDVATIASPATGLVIYNTATAGTTPTNVLPGYYYWDGSKWNGLVDQSSLNSFSGYVPNYAQSNASSVTKSSTGDIVVSQAITTSGRPIQIIATGDANPAQNGAWVQLQLYRDGTAIGKKIQAESSALNENIPYCLNYIDAPTAGTYTYSVKIVGGGAGGFAFGEADGNQITLLELGAWSAGTMPVSKGGTGNSSYTTGSLLFSDGTAIAQNNSKLFWDNTNNRLGVGTASPDASSIVDMSSTSKGLLPPRVALTSKTGTSSPVASPQTGLIVYNTASAGTGGDAVTPGYYYFNGTIWTRMDPEGWSNPVAITIGATTTAPVKGTTSIDYVRYRNVGGKEYEVEYNLVRTGGGTDGSGDYLITLPGSLQFDFTASGQTAYTGAAGYNAIVSKLLNANGDLYNTGAHNSATVIPYDATRFRVHTNNWGTVGWTFWNTSYYQLGFASSGFKMTFKFKAL